jgi:heterotetrameric sarcosine oxidase gamma subunit
MRKTAVSAPEPDPAGGERIGVRIAQCAADIIELAALRRQAAVLHAVAAARSDPLPASGRLGPGADGLILAVRPERWLLLCAPAAPGAVAQSWQTACAGSAAVIELSAALTAYHVTGAAARETLTRGCRLDLDPRVFPAGSAAATFMAQVPVIIGALASGVLLLTPSSTARHFHEWLIHVARPFGLAPLASVTVARLHGESVTL